MRKLSSGVLWLLLALVILLLALAGRRGPTPPDVEAAKATGIPGKATGPGVREVIRKTGDTEDNAIEF